MPTDRIELAEHATRRSKVLTALRNGIGLVFAGTHQTNLLETFRPHPHFEYLTGLTTEPGAVLLLDPTNPSSERRDMLFLAPLNPEREKWDGYRMEIAQSLRERCGFAAIHRLDVLPRTLTAAAIRSKRFCCLHPLAAYNQPISPDLERFRRVAERMPGAAIEDRTEILARMRAVKSRAEVSLVQRAVDITAAGYEAVLAALEPGKTEFDVQETIEHVYRTRGSRGPAYPTIAGGGLNSTVLHYRDNDQPLGNGEVICIDSGAGFAGYGADITRTFPVNGTFTDRQREVYEVVLEAELRAIGAVKPGVTFATLDDVARDVIKKAGFGDYFIHSIGHHLGLETHDINPDTPLKQGAVITIEPGIYIPEENLGVRIEDDVLVSRSGARTLSTRIPKTVAAIEKAMGG